MTGNESAIKCIWFGTIAPAVTKIHGYSAFPNIWAATKSKSTAGVQQFVKFHHTAMGNDMPTVPIVYSCHGYHPA